MKLKELLATLTAQNVQVTLKDKDSGAEIVTLTSAGYTSLEDTIEARKVESWRMLSGTKIEIVLGEILPDGGTTMKGIGFFDSNQSDPIQTFYGGNIVFADQNSWLVVNGGASEDKSLQISLDNVVVYQGTLKGQGGVISFPVKQGQKIYLNEYSATANLYPMAYDEE